MTTTDERTEMRRTDRAGVEAFVWSLVFRSGPIAFERLLELTRLGRAELESSLAALVDGCRVERDGDAHYRSRELLLGFDDRSAGLPARRLRVDAYYGQSMVEFDDVAAGKSAPGVSDRPDRGEGR
jgi:hypothetical protein